LGAIPPQVFLFPSNLVVPNKSFLNIKKTKIFPLKTYFSSQTLKPGYEPAAITRFSGNGTAWIGIRTLKISFALRSFVDTQKSASMQYRCDEKWH